MEDIKVLRLSRPYEPTVNITLENGCLNYYCDGEFMAMLCKPHLAEYGVVEISESVIKDDDMMTTPFSCDEEQVHFICMFDYLIRYEHFVTRGEERERVAAQRFEELYNFFVEKGGAI